MWGGGCEKLVRGGAGRVWSGGKGESVSLGELWEVACLCVGEVKCLGAASLAANLRRCAAMRVCSHPQAVSPCRAFERRIRLAGPAAGLFRRVIKTINTVICPVSQGEKFRPGKPNAWVVISARFCSWFPSPCSFFFLIPC